MDALGLPMYGKGITPGNLKCTNIVRSRGTVGGESAVPITTIYLSSYFDAACILSDYVYNGTSMQSSPGGYAANPVWIVPNEASNEHPEPFAFAVWDDGSVNGFRTDCTYHTTSDSLILHYDDGDKLHFFTWIWTIFVFELA